MISRDRLELAFLGAAGEVTGSCFLVTAGDTRFLVDCGMFQGGDAGARNAAALRFDGGPPEFVIVTHAHIDHSGLLPRLAARGFRGPVFATPATVDLLGVMLPDSAYLQEKEADRAARERRRGERPAVPLYTVSDATRALGLLQPQPYGRAFAPARDVRITFRDAGHILGSAIVEAAIALGERVYRLVFSGDLGQPGRPVMDDPALVAHADSLVVESTYGNRLHKPLASTLDEFAGVLTATLPRGNVVIPAFAVGRTQEVLHVLADLVRRGRVPDLTIFVDSPLAQRATEITAKYAASLDRDSRDLGAWLARHRDQVRMRFTETAADSIAINSVRSGAVIVAAGGMCEGGRVRHHLRHNLPRAECAVVFTGFQAAGTLGRQIVDGAPHVRLFGDDVPVRASVRTIGGLSAHADQAALLAWLAGFRAPPSRTFVVHGEAATAAGFAALIRTRLAWPRVSVPARGERVVLT